MLDVRAGEFEQSLAAFDEALAPDPSYARARYNRACVLARLDQFAPAELELERLLAEDLPLLRLKYLSSGLRG